MFGRKANAMKDPKYTLKDYKISYDHTLLDEQNHITPEIRRIIEELHPDLVKGRKYLIKKLGRLIERYPKVPIFKNMLSTVHKVNDEHDKAFKANRWLVKEHPDYLFGKVNYVGELINNEEFDKIPEELGDDMELQALYPNREEFHVEEFMAFNQSAIPYFLSQDNVEQAEMRLEMMQEIDPDHPNTLRAEDDLRFYFYKKAFRNKKNQTEIGVEVIEVDRRSDRQTTKPPNFNFPLQMQWIYEEDEFFPKEKLEKILQLDREPLIEDLEKALNDSIVRYDYWEKQQEEDWEPLAFSMHAIFLLIELKSEKSLSVWLEILKQNEEFVEIWYGDFTPQLTDAAIYGLGRNQLDLLIGFLKLPNVNGYNKANVCQGIITLVSKFPERRNEFIEVFRDLLNYLIEKSEDANYADTAGYSLIVSYVTDTGFKELLPEIKQLCETGLIDKHMYSDYQTIEKDIQEQDIGLITPEFVNGNIFEKYQILQENAERLYNEIEEEATDLYGDDDEFLFDKWLDDDDEFKNYWGGRKLDDEDLDDSSTDFNLSDQKPIIKEKEPGRNDPCPCGSGKKYKKCCKGPS